MGNLEEKLNSEIKLWTVLCRSLKEDRMTIELKSRVDPLVHLMKRRIMPDYIGITGGRKNDNDNFAEATLAWSYLVGCLDKEKIDFPTEKIIVEYKAKNTIENFKLILKKMKDTFFENDGNGHELSKTKATVFSTGYHIHRLIMNKESMPELSELLLMENEVKRCDTYRTPYPFLDDIDDYDPVTRWRGKLYTISDEWRVLGTNIWAIKDEKSKVEKLYPQVVENFSLPLDAFFKTLYDKSIDRNGEVQEITDKIAPKFREMEKAYYEIKEKIPIGNDLEDADKDKLIEMGLPNHINDIGYTVDPDRPI